MKLNAATRLQAASDETTEAQLTIKGPPHLVNRLLALIYTVQRAGAIGHSGTFAIEWDGDGADQIQVDGIPKDKEAEFKELADTLCSYGPTIECITGDTILRGVGLSNNPEGGSSLKRTSIYPEEPETDNDQN